MPVTSTESLARACDDRALAGAIAVAASDGRDFPGRLARLRGRGRACGPHAKQAAQAVRWQQLPDRLGGTAAASA